GHPGSDRLFTCGLRPDRGDEELAGVAPGGAAVPLDRGGAASAATLVLANAADDRAADAVVQHDLHKHPGVGDAAVFGGAQDDCVVSARPHRTGTGGELRCTEL